MKPKPKPNDLVILTGFATILGCSAQLLEAEGVEELALILQKLELLNEHQIKAFHLIIEVMNELQDQIADSITQPIKD